MSYFGESDGLDRAVRTHSASSNGESAVEAIVDDIYVSCRMEQLPCFHESTSRNVAENLLLSADEGAFLIRPSRVGGNYSVSVRAANSVKHFQIQHNGHGYDFGHAQFLSPSEIWTHLNSHPVLECDKGMRVHLLYPYENEKKLHSPIPEPGYATVNRHYLPAEIPQSPKKTTAQASTLTKRRSNNIVTSMEGQLYKRKKGKTWKRRWCVLNKNFFSYKRTEKTKKELKTLDLSEAVEVVDWNEPNMKYCFRIIFPKVYYVFATDCKEDKDIWFKSIKWQIDACILNEGSMKSS